MARRARAYQPETARAPGIPPPATTPAVRPWSLVPQRSHSFRPVTEVYPRPRIFCLHCSQRMAPMVPSGRPQRGDIP